ncbi:hypothetical protein C8R45DRAFT_176426 [Mycena sanguinolenta]|nr:hypothetical protein C8R45DRAFT_176426 [Mycena sanguinolenta]
MDPGQALESGSAGGGSGKDSVLQRLASLVSRALSRRTSTSKNLDPAVSQPERPDTEKSHYSDAENEEACAKIWSIYVGEAERYDAALVESWKADMEGMLVFSGLFSASLTAFLIESYKVLQPDSGGLTVAATALLSHQLAAIASNTSFVVPPSPICNTSSQQVHLVLVRLRDPDSFLHFHGSLVVCGPRNSKSFLRRPPGLQQSVRFDSVQFMVRFCCYMKIHMGFRFILGGLPPEGSDAFHRRDSTIVPQASPRVAPGVPSCGNAHYRGL